MRLPKISIIIVCFNEEKNIDTCLESLLDQNYPRSKFEIVIVDNASIDQTQEIIKKFQEKDQRIRLLINPFIGIAKSRNIGLKKACFPYVAFIDADCQAPRNWLKTLAKNLVSFQKKNSKIIAVGGPNFPLTKIPTFEKAVGLARTSFLIHHGSVQGKTYSKPTLVEHLPTVNVLYQKAPLLKISGFDENFGNIAEDLELSWRLKQKGYQFVFLPQVPVKHRLDKNLVSFSKKVFRYGKGRIWFFKKHPGAFRIIFLAPIFLLSLVVISPFLPQLLPVFLGYLVILFLSTLFLVPSISFIHPVFFIFLVGHFAYAFGEIYGLFTQPNSKKGRNVSLVVLYKCGNVGDAAIFQTALQVLPKKYHLNQLTALAFSPRGLLVKKINLPLNKKQEKNLLKKLFDPSLKLSQQISQFFKWIKSFFETDDLIFWGGYWLHDYTWYSLPLILALILLAKMMRKKVILSGIGAGPFKRGWSKTLLKISLNQIDYLSARDDFSLKSLKTVGVKKVKLSNYPVLLYPNLELRKRGEKKKKLIGFNLAAWFNIQNRWQFSKKSFAVQIIKAASLINQITKKAHAEIILLPSMFPEDVIVMKKIIRQVSQKDKVFLAFQKMPSPKEFQKTIAGLDLLISMRLHPLIFAYLECVPRIAIAYDPKVKAFMKKIGEEKNVFSFDQIGEKKFLQQIESNWMNSKLNQSIEVE